MCLVDFLWIVWSSAVFRCIFGLVFCVKATVGSDSFVKHQHLAPQTSIYKRLFQLDDFESLHEKWLFHQTSILNWLFGVPGMSVPIYLKLPETS